MKTNTIDIKVKASAPRIIFLGLWTIGLWVMVVVLLIGMIGVPSEIESLWFLWIVMIVLGIILTNHVIWEAFGKVKISFDSNSIRVVNRFNILKKEVCISMNEFRGIEYKKEENPITISFWGFTQGDILIKYKNGKRRFGKGLNKKESLQTINLIDEKVKTYTKFYV